MTRVKICGITNLRDADYAVRCGTDAIGFVFARSPRRISLSDARRISRAVGPWVATVGVFVNERVENILRAAETCCLSAIQLHGDEPASMLPKLSGFKIIKAFRVAGPEDLKQALSYGADAYLFDTRVQGVYGGSGKSFEWKFLRSRTAPKPLIISGGLDPQNVRQAIRMLKPYGVDVSSGVEKTYGKKDPKLMRKFIENAKKD